MRSFGSLAAFNEEMLACQDQAFTLAVYLLGDDQKADDVVQQACFRAYRRYQQRFDTPIQLMVFQEIIDLCGTSRRKGASGSWGAQLRLSRHECEALLLVDLLGLSYDHASDVLRCPRQQLAGWLADARTRLADSHRGSLNGKHALA